MSLKQSTLGYSRKQRTRSGTQEENSERKPVIHSTTSRSYLFTIFVSALREVRTAEEIRRWTSHGSISAECRSYVNVSLVPLSVLLGESQHTSV